MLQGVIGVYRQLGVVAADICRTCWLWTSPLNDKFVSVSDHCSFSLVASPDQPMLQSQEVPQSQGLGITRQWDLLALMMFFLFHPARLYYENSFPHT